MVIHVQYLRAFAVVGVLLFHMGLPIFSSGYFGVDVFFVISGFVITRSLLNERKAEGSISLKNFWGKRVRRLAPALTVVIIFTLVLGLFLYPTFQQFFPVALTAFAGGIAAANVPIAFFSADYFGPESSENALLHLWSLGVEEQFYIFFPLLLVLIFYVGRTRRVDSTKVVFLTMLAVAAVSFGLYLFYEEIRGAVPVGQTLFGFYSPLPRAWEFTVGVLIAILASRQHALLDFFGSKGWLYFGYALIGSSFSLPQNPEAQLSWIVIFPVMGTGLVLMAENLPGESNFRLAALVAKLGDLSYSLYLWHWPLIVAANLLVPGNLAWSVGLGIFSVIPAYITHRFVENPMRFRQGALRAQALSLGRWSLVGVSTAVLTSGALFATVIEPVNNRLALNGELGYQALEDEIDKTHFPCVGFENCWQSKPNGNPQMLIIGRSHGQHLLPGLSEAYPDLVVAFLEQSHPVYTDLEGGEALLSSIVKNSSVEIVVIGEPWLRPGTVNKWEPLHRAVSVLTRNGKRVLIPDGVPSLEVPIAGCKYAPLIGLVARNCEFPSISNNQRHNVVREQLNRIAFRNSDVQIVGTYGLFCDEATCRAGDKAEVWFYDIDHLGVLGSIRAAGGFDLHVGFESNR